MIAHGVTAAPTSTENNGLEGLGIQVLGGRGTRSFAMIGHGSGYEGNRHSIWDQTHSGDLTVRATTGAIRLQGHNQAIRDGNLNTGAIIPEGVVTPESNESDAGNLGSFVQIGHGGQHSSSNAAGGTFIMPGGTNVNTIVPDGSIHGEIDVFAGGTYLDPENAETPMGLLLRAGNRHWYYAMIGHGGTNHTATNASDVTPDFGEDAVLPFAAPVLAASTGFHGNIRVEVDQGSFVATGGDSFRSASSWGFGYNFVRVGHGGDAARGDKGGTISVLAGQGAGAVAGDILFTAGRMNRSHAHIGHGGYDSAGGILGPDNSAEITVTAGGSLAFVSPESGERDALGLSIDYTKSWYNSTSRAGYWDTSNRWVKIGHGGRSGVLTMPNQQDITVTSGTHDSGNADGDASTGGITFIAGDSNQDFAHLGHGGYVSAANNPDGFTGDILVNSLGGGIRFDGSVLGAQMLTRRTTNASRDGVNDGTAQPLLVGVGGGADAFVQLGHGGYASRGIHRGEITVHSWGGLAFLGAPAAPVVDRVGNTTVIESAMAAGSGLWVPLAEVRDTVLPDKGAANYFTQFEIHSNIIPGSVRITLSDGRVITDVPRNSSSDNTSAPINTAPTPDVFIPQPDAGLFLDGVKVGEIHYSNGLVSFRTGGVTDAANTTSGLDPVAAPVDLGGATVVSTTFQNAQGHKERAYVQLGHGGYDTDGPSTGKVNSDISNRGNITILAGGDIRFEGGATHRSSAQLGHGGYGTKGSSGGTITINHIDPGNPLGTVGGLRFLAGHGGHRQYDYYNYAQLGHGGFDADGNHFGNIFVRGTEDAEGMGLFLKAGDRQDSYAMVGHGGYGVRTGSVDPTRTYFGLNGDIDIEVTGDVVAVAGTLSTKNPAYRDDGRLMAQIGHGGYDADASNDSSYFLGETATNPLLPVGSEGAGDGNWGHFGDIRVISSGGDISFMAGSNVALGERLDIDGDPLPLPAEPNGYLISHGGGKGRFHWAQIGHGGYSAAGDHHGNIDVIAENGSVHLVGGMMSNDNSGDKWNWARIGHGGGNVRGHLGRTNETIRVNALGSGGDILVAAGNGNRNQAQIGNGGISFDGSHKGAIELYAGRDIYLRGGVAQRRVVKRIGEFQEMNGSDGGHSNDIGEFERYYGATGGLGYVLLDEAASTGSGAITKLIGSEIQPGTLELRLAIAAPALFDAGAAPDFVDVDKGNGTGSIVENGNPANVVGTISYATGEMQFDLSIVTNADGQPDVFVNYDHRTAIRNDAYAASAMVGHGGFGSNSLAEAHPEDGTPGFVDHGIAGDIDVRAGVDAAGQFTGNGGSITALAGNDVRTYVQIGHGGAESNQAAGHALSGSITTKADGSITFRGGGGLVDNQHIAFNYYGSGNNQVAAVTAAHAANATNPDYATALSTSTRTNSGISDILYAFAHIGHGGVTVHANDSHSNNANNPLAAATADTGHNGAILVETSSGSIDFTGGGGRGYAHFAMIGHGGYSVNGNHHGGIEVNSGDSIRFAAGGESYRGSTADKRSFAQIGHGGRNSVGNLEGAIIVTAQNEISFQAGDAQSDPSRVPYGAHIYVLNAAGNQDENHVNRSESRQNFALLGHGGSYVTGDKTGDITVEAGNGVSFRGGDRLDGSADNNAANLNFAQIGHGGYQSWRQIRTDLLPSEYTYGDNWNLPFWWDATTSSYVIDGTLGPNGDGQFFWPTDNSIDAAFGFGNPLYDGFSGDLRVTATRGDIHFEGGTGQTAFVQIGHGGTETGGDHNGDIEVKALAGDIHFSANRIEETGSEATSSYTFAKIGHGGAFSSGEQAGDVVVEASGEIRFKGGRNDSFAMVGHGGRERHSTGATSGWGTGRPTVRHSANYVNDRQTIYRPGTRTGDITVLAGGDLAFVGGNANGDRAFTQIGHGGFNVHANPEAASPYGDGHSGAITVLSDNGSILMQAGKRAYAHAQIGHGGTESFGNHGGDGTDNRADSDIFVEAATGIRVMASGRFASNSTSRNFAQIGHGGWRSSFRDIEDISSEGYARLQFYGGNYINPVTGLENENKSGMHPLTPSTTNVNGLGMGPRAQLGVFQGDITVRTTGSGADIRFLAPNAAEGTLGVRGEDSYVQLGHGGWRNLADVEGNITVESGGEVEFRALQGAGSSASSNHNAAFAKIGHGGHESGGKYTGNIGVTAAGDISFHGADSVNGANAGFTQIGHGGYNTWVGTTHYREALRDPVSGAIPGSLYSDGNFGDITIQSGGDVEFLAGKDSVTFAQVGHGGYASRDSHGGNITVIASGGVRFIASTDLPDNMAGFNPGDNNYAYAQMGHGGYNADGTHYGDIHVTAGTFAAGAEAGKGIVFRSGDWEDNYSQLGHGGTNSRTYGVSSSAPEGLSGNITVQSEGDILFVAGTVRKDIGEVTNADGRLYTQLGHGGYDADSNRSSTATIAGSGEGHHGDISVISSHGSISFLAGDIRRAVEPSVGTGGGRFNGALLGHGGTYAASGDHHGNIYVRAGIEADGTVNNANADVWFQGGSTTEDNDGGYNIAQLGHGGHSAAGNHGLVTETITVMSGRDITFQAGDDNYAYAQLGNGGFSSRGDHGGDIQIFAERDIRFAASQFPASTPLGSGLRTTYGYTSATASVYHRNLDRAGNFEETTTNTIVGKGVATLNYQRVIEGSVSIEIRLDDGTIIGNLKDDANGDLVAVGAFSYDFDGSGTIESDEMIADGEVVGTVNDYSGGQLTFHRDINPGASTGTSNIILTMEHRDVDYTIAQLGHGGYDSDNPNGGVTLGSRGDIRATARTGNVTLTGGSDDESYVLVGHGGRSTAGANSGDIIVRAAGQVDLLAGSSNRTSTQIGHGGYDANGDHSGDIMVSAGSGRLFTSLSSAKGDPSGWYDDLGDFDLNGTADEIQFAASDGGVTLQAGGYQSSATIGLGGYSAEGHHTGHIGVSAWNDIHVLGGTGSYSNSQIGHGSYNTATINNMSGDISVISEAGDLTVKAGAGFEAYALIGHGNDNDSNTSNAGGTRQGRVHVVADHITLDRYGNRIAWIGHTFDMAANNNNPFADQTLANPADNLGGGYEVIGRSGLSYLSSGSLQSDGTITVTDSFRDRIIAPNLVSGNFVMSGGNFVINTVLDESTVYATPASQGHDITFLAAGDIDVNRRIQSPGSGAVNLIAGANLGNANLVDAPSRTGGVSGTNLNFSRIDHLWYAPTGHIDMSLVRSDALQWGHDHGFSLTSSEFFHAAGEISLDATNNGGNFGASAGSLLGETHVLGHGVRVVGGNSTGEEGRIGFRTAAAAASGDIHVGAREGGVHLSSGAGGQSYAHIGHGGQGSAVALGGDITVASGGVVSVTAASATDSTARIGHGGNLASGTVTDSTIRVDAVGALSLTGGGGTWTMAQIGHGGSNAIDLKVLDGDIVINSAPGSGGGALTLIGGGSNAAAMIGHGGSRSDSARGTGDNSASGDIFIGRVSGVVLEAGTGPDSFAQIGHGGEGGVGSRSGNVTLLSAPGGAVSLSGGGGSSYAYAMIGHGGNSNAGAKSGDIFLNVDPLTFDVIPGGGLHLSGGGAAQSFAQIGHGGFDGSGDIQGSIVGFTASPLEILGGGGSDSFAQIGHGGRQYSGALGQVGEVIAVGALGGVSLEAGATRSYAQIGSGGHGSAGDLIGAVFVNVNPLDGSVAGGGAIQLHGGQTDAYAQIGHGGTGSSGNRSGDVSVLAGGAVSLLGGTSNAYAQIGHGGADSTSTVLGGNVTVRADGGVGVGDLTLTGGGSNAYSLIGHGGTNLDATISGRIVAISGALSLGAGTGQASFAQIGHGGSYSNGIMSGDIFLQHDPDADGGNGEDRGGGGALSLTATTSQAYAQIGHGGVHTGAGSGDKSGHILLAHAASATFTGGTGNGAYAQLGHGGRTLGSGSAPVAYDLDGSIILRSAGALVMQSGGADAYTQIGHGGRRISGSKGGTGQVIDVTAASVSLAASNAFSMIGHGGAWQTPGDATADITVTATTGGISVVGGLFDDFAMIGHGGLSAGSGDRTGSITLTTPGDLILTAGTDKNSFARVGHAGWSNNGVLTGDIGIDAGGNVVLASGGHSNLADSNNTNAVTQIGHGGWSATGVKSGDISVVADGALGVSLSGGIGLGAFSQIGHGGHNSSGDLTGEVTVQATAGGVALTAGTGPDNYAMIGLGGRAANGSKTGDVSVEAAGAASLLGGGLEGSFAQIGNGGNLSTGNSEGSVTLKADGDLTLRSGAGASAFTQIGHGGVGAVGSHGGSLVGGEVFVGAAGDLLLQAGGGVDAYTQIGHGGVGVSGDHLGEICVHADGTITFNDGTQGSGVRAYVQVGHGGYGAAGDHGGRTNLVSGFAQNGGITMNGGSGDGQYVQVGHGGTNASGNLSGRVFVVADKGGDLVMNGGAGDGSYAMISHGDGHGTYGDFGSGTTGGTREGGIQYFVDGEAKLEVGSGADSNVHLIHRTSDGGGLSAGNYGGGNGYQYVVNGVSSGSAYPMARENESTVIAGNFGTGNIVVTNTGDLTLSMPHIPAPQFVDHNYSFIVLATGDLHFDRGFQNAGSGVVALVAGWDGVQDASSVTFNNGVCDPEIIPGSIDFNDCDRWGQNGGALTIGNSTRTTGIAVGSRAGSTLLRGHRIEILGGSGAGAYTQIGFRGDGGGAISGAIDVRAKAGGIHLASGTGNGAYTQIGHGGRGSTPAEITAPVTIRFCEAGDVTLAAGGVNAYSMIGHGGEGLALAAGGWSGDLTIHEAANVSLSGGTGSGSFTRIGHGGKATTALLGGNIDIEASGNLLVAGGSGSDSSAQIGLGGRNHEGDRSGGIFLDFGGAATVSAGTHTDSYAQIGHGSRVSPGNNTGDISLTTGGDIAVVAGDDSVAREARFAMIGHGGFTANGSHSGDIHVESAGGGIAVTAGGQANNFAMVGHGGRQSRGDHGLVDGDGEALETITVRAAGDIVFTGGGATRAFAQLGHGGSDSDLAGGPRGMAADIEVVSSGGNVRFRSGNGNLAYAQLGHGGGGTTGDHRGDVIVRAAEEILMEASQVAGSSNGYVQIGHGGSLAEGDHRGTIEVLAGLGGSAGGITALGGVGSGGADRYVQIGHGGRRARGAHSGDIRVEAFDTIYFRSGATRNFAQIGHGGSDAAVAGSSSAAGDAGNSGDITVKSAAGSIEFRWSGPTTSPGTDTYVQIGHGGTQTGGDHHGDITVTADQNLLVRSTSSTGTAQRAYAQLGHGGYSAGGNLSGDIVARAENGTLQVRSGGSQGAGAMDGASRYAQLGHGGAYAAGDHLGDISVFSQGSITFSNLSSSRASRGGYAQLGHGGYEAAAIGGHEGAITVATGAALTFTAATAGSNDAYAQLGHGGTNAGGDHRGDIAVLAQGNIQFTRGQDGQRNYAQLGHGGHGAVAPNGISGRIAVATLTGRLGFLGMGSATAGVAVESYNQLGHGGVGATGDHSGDIFVRAGNNVQFESSRTPGSGSYTQLGHGGMRAEGNHSGDIFLSSQIAGSFQDVGDFDEDGIFDDLTFVAGSSGEGVVFVSGNLDVAAEDAYAQLGHGGRLARGNHNGGITVDSLRRIRFVAGQTGLRGYAQAGHGGHDAAILGGGPGTTGNSGDITLTSRTGVAEFRWTSASVATSDGTYVQLGHGGYVTDPAVGGVSAGGDHSGNVSLTADGNVMFRGTSGGTTVDGTTSEGNYVQMGHGGLRWTGNHSGDIRAQSANGTVVFTAGNSSGSHADTFLAGGPDRYAQLGHGGAFAAGGHSGDISVLAGSHLQFFGGRNPRSYAQLGHGGFGAGFAGGSNSGGIRAASRTGNVEFRYSMDGTSNSTTSNTPGLGSYVQMGHGGYDNFSDNTGDIVLRAGGNLLVRAPRGNNPSGHLGSYAQVGHGGFRAEGDTSGNITVSAGLDGSFQDIIDLDGDGVLDAVALVSNGSGTIRLQSGAGGTDRYARIGHGGTLARGNHGTVDGNGDAAEMISVTGLGDVTVQSRGGTRGYAQIGNGGMEAHVPSALRGAAAHIEVRSLTGGVFATGSTGSRAFAQIGNGGGEHLGDHRGDILVAAGTDVSFTASQSNTSTGSTGFVQLGHGGLGATGDHYGDITVRSGLLGSTGEITFTAGKGSDRYAQLGHGGRSAGGDHSGSLLVESFGGVSFLGGDSRDAVAVLAAEILAAAQAGGGGSGRLRLSSSAYGNQVIRGSVLIALSDPVSPEYAEIRDDLQGNLVDMNGGIVGTINYSNAAATFAVALAGGGTGEARTSFSGTNFSRAYAQLGHGGSASAGTKSGTITVAAGLGSGGGDVLFRGGVGSEGFAQLGHGGISAVGNHSGGIAVNTPGSVFVTGGGSNSSRSYVYAQIGHGGVLADGDHEGSIEVHADGLLDITAGGGVNSIAAIGHGGRYLGGALDGAISVSGGGGIRVVGGQTLNPGDSGGGESFAQIGHHGLRVATNDSTLSGAITVASGTGIDLLGGANQNTYAAIGHGGRNAQGTRLGNVTVTASDDIVASSGGGVRAFTQIGHLSNVGSGTISGPMTGSVSVTSSGGDIAFSAGSGNNSYARVGHGGSASAGVHSGSIAVRSFGEVSFVAGTQTNAHAQIGHGGASSSGSVADAAVSVDAGGAISFLAGSDTAYAQIGHGGYASVSFTVADSDITLNTAPATGAGDLTIRGGAVNAYAMIGHGGTRSDGTIHNGDVSVTSSDVTVGASANIHVTGGGNTDGFAQIGHGGERVAGDWSGDISLFSSGVIALTGGTGGNNAYALVGHGGILALGEKSGDIFMNVDPLSLAPVSGGSVSVVGGTATRSFAQIGHGGFSLIGTARGGGDISGEIHLFSGDDVEVRGGSGADSYAQTGHGGSYYAGTVTDGAISVNVVDSIRAIASATASVSARIGHGGFNVLDLPVLNSDITINQFAGSGQGDIILQGGSTNSSAMIGHGGGRSDGNVGLGDISASGDILIANAANISVIGGNNTDGFAQIGHGGERASGTHGGELRVNTAGDIEVRGGSAGNNAYAMIGHGGAYHGGALGPKTGSLILLAGGHIGVAGGSAVRAAAQVGHGGLGTGGDFSGELQLVADSLLIEGGSSSDAYGLVGHGGFGTGLAPTGGSRSGNLLARITGLTELADRSSRGVLGHTGSAGLSGASRFALVTGGIDTSATLAGLSGLIENVIGAGSVEIGVTNGDLRVDGTGAWYDSVHHLDLLATGNTTFLAGVQNGGGGAIHGVAGWDGETGLVEAINTADATPISALALDATTVLATPSAYANNGAVLSVGDGTQSAGVAVGAAADATNLYGDAVRIVAGSGGPDRFAQVGYRGVDATPITGAITLATRDGGVEVRGSADSGGFAQIGHGGLGTANAAVVADISLVSQGAGDLRIRGGDGLHSYALVGHGGTNYVGPLNGTIAHTGPIDALELAGGAGLGGFAQLGHGGDGSTGAKTGDLFFTAAGIDLLGGLGARTGARIGHGGRGGAGEVIGTIELTATAGDIRAVANSGNVSSVQIGHGGRDYHGSVVNQAITVDATGGIFLTGGTQVQSSALIGHGGGSASGADISGEILLTAGGDLAVRGGGGFLSFAQVGHGGALATSAFSGDVRIATGGDVSVLAPTSTASGAYAKIGHGDDMRAALAAIAGIGTRLGDVEIAIAGSLTLTEALLGHRNAGSLADSGGTVMVGVAVDDPANGAGGDLVADAETQFTGDEVRFYLPRRANNRVAPGALMNSVAYGGGLSDPWPLQGADEFTRFLVTDNGILTLDEHDSTFGSGPAPTTVGAHGFYFDTLVQGDPPQPDAPLASLLPSAPPESPLPEMSGVLDDRLLLDSIDQQEAHFSGPGFTEIFYEGFAHYGTNGEVHFHITDPGQLTPTVLPYFAPAGLGLDNPVDEEEDILRQHLEALEQSDEDESSPEDENSEDPSGGELVSGAEG